MSAHSKTTTRSTALLLEWYGSLHSLRTRGCSLGVVAAVRTLKGMKVWELIAKLEGTDPEAEIVVRDGEATLLLDHALIEPPAERTRRVVLVAGP